MSIALGTQEVAARLASRLGDAPRNVPALTAFAPREAPARVVAVDGSSVALAQSGDLLLGAHRAARVRLDAGRTLVADAPAPEVVLLDAREGSEPLRARLAAWDLGDLDLPRLPPDALLDALRTLGELAACAAALPELQAGDALLVDGPLQERATLPLMGRLLASAERRRVDVVGVCKSTSLALGGVPALVACHLAARAGPDAPWFAPLDAPANVPAKVVVARLSGAEVRAFRFDVRARDGDVARVLGGLAALAGHPAYPGYPSPLAMAHNAAVLTEETRRRLVAELEEESVRAGVSPAAWEAAFVDYHDVLELGV